VVLEQGKDYQRRDYSAESWSGPPEGTIGWWKNRMPTAEEKRWVLAPKEVLIDLLRQMADAPSQAKSRYLLALMLMRRRIVRPATAAACGGLNSGTEPPRDATGENDDERELLRVEVSGDSSVLEIPVCRISRAEADELRDELNALIYCEAED